MVSGVAAEVASTRTTSSFFSALALRSPVRCICITSGTEGASRRREKDGEGSLSLGGFSGGRRTDGERRRLLAAPEVELGEDVAHVVAGGLRADVQARGDLGVRQAVAEQR